MAYDAHDDGRRDFHFLYGRWTVAHQRLRQRGVGLGRPEWDSFEGTSFCQGLLGGLSNVEEHDFPDRGHQGLALRTFDVERGLWSIYWVSSQSGVLEPPVTGRFENGVGRFHGDDVDAGRPVKVAFLWDRITPGAARWSQSFSYDGGQSWEENWIMEFTRTA
jgi:hypothetical protein